VIISGTFNLSTSWIWISVPRCDRFIPE